MTFPSKDSFSWVAEHVRQRPPTHVPPRSPHPDIRPPWAHQVFPCMWICKPTPSIQLQKYRHSESSLSIIPGRGFITLRRHLGTRNMSPQWAVEGLWSEEEGEEGEESGADLTHLAWFAIIAPSLSVLERPSRHTIWTQLPTVYQWPLSPPLTPDTPPP